MTEVDGSPVVPPGNGPRVMFWLYVTSALVASVIVVVTFLGGGSAVLARAVGVTVGEDVRARVVEGVTVERAFPKRGGCDVVRFGVVWVDGGRGEFTVCVNRPLERLQIGDRVDVHTLPFVDDVLPDGEPYTFWAVAGLLLAGCAAAASVRAARQYRRLMVDGARGPRLDGVVEKVSRNALTVIIGDGHAGQGRRLVLSPAEATQVFTRHDPVRLWASRRSWLRRRPRGPWVVQSHRTAIAYTHGWWRRGVRPGP